MTSILRAALLMLLVSISVQVKAADNEAATSGGLERRIVDLERRVAELESANKSAPQKVTRPSATGNWKDIQNWRQLRIGMSYDEVRALLGEPDNVEGGFFTYWSWGGRAARVRFVSDKVDQWSEPR